jgi:nitrogen regulatory protein PII
VKKIEAIIRPFRLEEVRDALIGLGIHGMTISEVKGCGRFDGRHEHNDYVLEYCHKIKMEIVVADAMCGVASEAVAKAAWTGKMGDGLILISQLEEAIRIRTQKTDQMAVV